MKKIMFAMAALLGAAFALGEKKHHNKYPAVFWSEAHQNEFSEKHDEATFSGVADAVKNLVGDSTANTTSVERVYVIRKEGMTTQDFFRAARYLEYDRSIMMNHSIAFSQVGKKGFDNEGEAALENAFGGIKSS